MAEVQRVPINRPPSRNWLPTIGAAFGLFLALAILKPWGHQELDVSGRVGGPTFAVKATAAASERPPRDRYDPRLFGTREPDPAWELWPAGYVVQFGLAGPLSVNGNSGTSPSPGPSLSPTGRPTSSPGMVGVVDLGSADHLVALGINTPLDARAATIRLWLVVDIRAPVEVPTVRLPTLWESRHFTVIAVEDPTEHGRPGPWAPGLYRLDITSFSGDLRQILIRVQPPLG